jgi:hypothetical protein
MALRRLVPVVTAVSLLLTASLSYTQQLPLCKYGCSVSHYWWLNNFWFGIKTSHMTCLPAVTADLIALNSTCTVPPTLNTNLYYCDYLEDVCDDLLGAEAVASLGNNAVCDNWVSNNMYPRYYCATGGGGGSGD